MGFLVVPLLSALAAIGSLVAYVMDETNIGFGLFGFALTFALLARTELNR